MKKTIATLFLLGTMGILGCSQTKIEYSQQKRIEGIVVKKEHIREHYLNPKDNINPMRHIDPMFNFKNNRFITKSDEKFNVSIDTEVKRYTLNDENLYNQLSKGQKVDVFYKEVYRELYKDIDNDGKKEMTKRDLVDFEFISANPRKD